jgi:hypothetical protein
VRVVLKLFAVGALLLSCSSSVQGVASTPTAVLESETANILEGTSTTAPPVLADSTKSAKLGAMDSAKPSTSSDATQTPTTVQVAKHFELCDPLDHEMPADKATPTGSITRHCLTGSEKVAFDFVGYRNVLPHLFEDVVMSVFTAAELFPLADDAFSGTADVLVAVWHRFRSDHQEVAEHRCAYAASESPWCVEDLQDPMISQGIGMSMLSRNPVMFEIVWPTEDQHIDSEVSHWLRAAHEWLHIYGMAHTADMDGWVEGPAVVPLDGPVWLREGLADYVGALIGDYVGESGFGSTYSEWVAQTHNEFTRSIGVLPSEVLANCTTPASQVRAEEMGGAWQCPAGRVAVLQLLNLPGVEPLARIREYFREVKKAGWEEAFRSAFGRSPRVFYEEFGEFLLRPLDEKETLVRRPSFSGS